MKKLVLFYTALVASIFAGLNIQQDPGYALIAFNKWTIEMPLWALVISLILLIIITHFCFNIISSIGSLRYRYLRFIKKLKHRTSDNQTREGLIAYSEGNWKQSEKHLLKGLTSSDSPLINYLTAAKAAQEQNKSHQRDKYLREAEKYMPDAKVAILLTQAKLQLSSKQYEQAHATLCLLHSLVPKHPHVLKLMLSLYKKIDDWQELSKLLPKLRRNKIINNNELLELEKNIYLNKIKQAMNQENKGALLQVWNQLPSSLKKDTQLVILYTKKLIQKEEYDFAESILRQQIKKNWHEELIQLYGSIENVDVNKQLKFIESFKKSQSKSAALYQTLGILSKKLQLWGKAKDYLEKSSELKPTERNFFELGELHHLLNNETSACENFREGLSLTISSNPNEKSKKLIIRSE